MRIDGRTRARFERKSSGTDAYGNPSGEWSLLGTVGANLRETPGKESLQAGRLESSRTGTLRVRASTVTKAVIPSDRVTVRGTTWSIISGPVQIDVKGLELEFTLTTEGAS
ncbi:MAG: head-tail adaptor protein [Shimia thalassica]|uniref:head-tail adaptor protein n=1 Tax=Shimia thalassica TaxID=1715693 RepID=UPI00329837A2